MAIAAAIGSSMSSPESRGALGPMRQDPEQDDERGQDQSRTMKPRLDVMRAWRHVMAIGSELHA
jgi:hypothetical protein